MQLPRKLKAFNTYVNGENEHGQVKEAKLPTIKRKLEDYQPGGFDAPVPVDLGGEVLEVEHTYGGWMTDLLAQMGGSLNSVQIRFQGALQREDSDEYDELRVTMRGRHEEVDLGNAKQGEDTEHKFKTKLTYYKVEINGRTIIEIDIMACKWIVNGVDQFAKRRRALGLG